MVKTNTDEMAVIGLVSGGHFFSHFYGLVLPPLFWLMADDLRVGFGELGLLVGAMAAASALVQLPAGIAVDRWGPFWPLATGLGLRAGAILLMGVAPSYWQILGLAIVAGAGNSVFHPADYAILSARVGQRRIGRAFSLHSFAGHLGWALAPLLMGLLAAGGSWRTALIAAGLAGLAMGLLLLLQQNRLRHDPDRTLEGEDGRGGRRREPLVSFPVAPIITILLVFLLDALAMKGLQTFLVPVVMTIHETSITTASALLTLFFAGSAGGILLGGVFADRVPRHRAVAGLSLAATATLIVLMGTGALTSSALTALVICAGVCHGLLPPFRDLIVRAATPARATGRAFALVSVGFDLGSAVAPSLFGLALDADKPIWVFWMAAGCLLAAALGLAALTGDREPAAATGRQRSRGA